MLKKPWTSAPRRLLLRHAGCLELLGVGLALVAERIEAGGTTVRGRETGQVARQQRRAARVPLLRCVR